MTDKPLYKKNISELINDECDCYWCCELSPETSKSEKLCSRSIDEERLKQWAIACLWQLKYNRDQYLKSGAKDLAMNAVGIINFLIDKFELTEEDLK